MVCVANFKFQSLNRLHDVAQAGAVDGLHETLLCEAWRSTARPGVAAQAGPSVI